MVENERLYTAISQPRFSRYYVACGNNKQRALLLAFVEQRLLLPPLALRVPKDSKGLAVPFGTLRQEAKGKGLAVPFGTLRQEAKGKGLAPPKEYKARVTEQGE